MRLHLDQEENAARAVLDTCRHYFEPNNGIALISVSGSDGYYNSSNFRIRNSSRKILKFQRNCSTTENNMLYLVEFARR
jgi:hypothetical protein